MFDLVSRASPEKKLRELKLKVDSFIYPPVTLYCMLIPQQHELWDARLVVALVYVKFGIHNFHILEYIIISTIETN